MHKHTRKYSLVTNSNRFSKEIAVMHERYAFVFHLYIIYGYIDKIPNAILLVMYFITAITER